PRDEIVPPQIGLSGEHRASGLDALDPPRRDPEGAGHDLVAQDDARVGQAELAHAAASCRLTARVATASRTSASWKVPTIAAPRSRASRIRSTTRARLAASGGRVGSGG